MLELVSFGLPPMFPPELMPDAGARFVAECRAGMTQRDLVRLAESRGWRPGWHALPHLGEHVYGFGLTIDGCGVPLMVRMRRIERPAPQAAVHASLFWRMDKTRPGSLQVRLRRVDGTRHWQARVRAAATQLTQPIERLERCSPAAGDMSDWLSSIDHLCRRLNRIFARYKDVFR